MVGPAARVLVMALLVFGAALTPPPGPAAQARGEDVCPEPNDTFQEACSLGTDADALGFISSPTDTDGYKIEVLDFGVAVRVELADLPLPYRVELANWNGDVIVSSDAGTLEATAPVPGTYYAFVDSPTGQYSDGQPYRIVARLAYPGAVPQRLFRQDYRPGHDAGLITYDPTIGDFAASGGRVTIAMKVAGTRQAPGLFLVELLSQGARLEATDFTMSFDVRVGQGAEPGYHVRFRRSSDNLSYYYVTFRAVPGSVVLGKRVDNQVVTLTGWIPFPAIGAGDRVHRSVVRAVGPDLWINVDGQEVIRHADESRRSGGIAYGAVTWAEPATVHFDNILVTAPGES